jgi:microcystin-dependent protein
MEKTGYKIRYKGVYRLYRNGVLVNEIPYSLLDAFGDVPAITVEELELMTTPDIEARAALMIEHIAGRCSEFNVINNIIYPSAECMDEEDFMIGQIIDYAGIDGSWDTDKWLKCDGSTLSTNNYPELYAVIGRAWTDDGTDATHFRLPNLRGRVTLGHDETTSDNPKHATNSINVQNYRRVGNDGGTMSVNLTGSQNGPHTHDTEKFSRRGYPDESGDRTSNYYWISEATDPGNVGMLSIESSGSAMPHENRQPYAVVFKLIRYK